jgi:hypothetical protein
MYIIASYKGKEIRVYNGMKEFKERKENGKNITLNAKKEMVRHDRIRGKEGRV